MTITEKFVTTTTDDWHISIARGIESGESLVYEAPRDAEPYMDRAGWYRNQVFHTSLKGKFEMTGPEPCPYIVPPFGNVRISGVASNTFVGNPAGARGKYTLTALNKNSAYLCMEPRDRATWYRWQGQLLDYIDGDKIQFLGIPEQPNQQILVLRGGLMGNRKWVAEDLFKIALQTHPEATAAGRTTLLQMWLEK